MKEKLVHKFFEKVMPQALLRSLRFGINEMTLDKMCLDAGRRYQTFILRSRAYKNSIIILNNRRRVFRQGSMGSKKSL